MTNPYDEDLSRFAVTFMRAIIAWNNAESSARSILANFGGGSIGLTIAAEQLGSRSLNDALLTLCDLLGGNDVPLTNELASHVAHFVDGMDTLRGYRNFYVHSLRFTGKAADDPKSFRGFLHATEVRTRYAWISQQISTDDVGKFMRHTMELRDYGREITEAMPTGSALNALRGSGRLVSSLQKPTWPEKLKKHRDYLRAQPPPP